MPNKIDVFLNCIVCSDAQAFLKSLPSQSVHCIVTSPPYFGLRSYLPDTSPDKEKELGLEDTPDAYIARLVTLFREARRVLRDDGVFWLNLGDSYAASGYSNHANTGGAQRVDGGKQKHLLDTGLPPKNLLGIPWRVALALQADGWILRSDIIWAKPNPMPESVKDRCTKSHEYVFMFVKSGTTQLWKHRDGRWAYEKQPPDYRWYDRVNEIETDQEPDGWQTEKMKNGKLRWRRFDLWEGRDYFWDQEAVREKFSDERMGNPGAYNWTYANNPETGKGIRGSGGPSTKLQNEGWNASGDIRGRNRRSVWTISTEAYSAAHFAVFPPRLVRPMILAGCPKDGIVLDPFMGAGTTGLVARRLGRDYVGCDLNREYVEMARKRIDQEDPTKPKELATGEKQLSLWEQAANTKEDTKHD